MCNGYNGASLTFEENGVFRIRGIVSGGVPKDGQIYVCDPNEYVIFTDVAQFIPWIKESVPQLKQSTLTNGSGRLLS